MRARPFLLLVFTASFRVLPMSVTVTPMEDTRKEAVNTNNKKGRAQTAEERLELVFSVMDDKSVILLLSNFTFAVLHALTALVCGQCK